MKKVAQIQLTRIPTTEQKILRQYNALLRNRALALSTPQEKVLTGRFTLVHPPPFMATGRTYLHWQPSRGGYTQATPQTQTKTTALPSERIKQILVRECGVPPRMIRDKGVAGVDVDLEGLPESRCQPGGPGYHEAKKSFQSRSSSLSTTQRSSGRSRQSPRV